MATSVQDFRSTTETCENSMAAVSCVLFHILPLFRQFAVIVVCSLICLYTLEAYIANTMDPDQTAPKACADPESFVRGVQSDGVFFS